MVAYNGGYLWPPRPENKIPSAVLGNYEKTHWCQFKKNGTCNVLIIAPDKTFKTWTRHKEAHKNWTCDQQTIQPILDVSKGWTVFVTEVLHSKVPGIRDTQYIFDILVYDGNFLFGKTFAERQALISNLFEKAYIGETISHYIVSDNIWVAKNHTSGFKEMFDNISNPEDEGLVLKNPKAKLDLCNKQSSNNGWQLKCRKIHKNYSF